jgi:hypothetical protein
VSCQDCPFSAGEQPARARPVGVRRTGGESGPAAREQVVTLGETLWARAACRQPLQLPFGADHLPFVGWEATWPVGERGAVSVWAFGDGWTDAARAIASGGTLPTRATRTAASGQAPEAWTERLTSDRTEKIGTAKSV